MSLKNSISNLFFKNRQIKENIDQFKNIMNFANSVIDNFEKFQGNQTPKYHPIIDVIRLLGRKIQTKYMIDLLYNSYESNLPRLEYSNILFETIYPITSDRRFFSDIKKKVFREIKLELGKDLILPWPWKRERLIGTISTIGDGRLKGTWEQTANHNVEFWLPMGIGWVDGGNHSITAGIIQDSGEIQPNKICDVSEIYNYIYTDGINYIRKHDRVVISPVRNIEFAAIFEIGRMMKEKSISY